jgi:thiol-disulfide isomerase/thioredoxin
MNYNESSSPKRSSGAKKLAFAAILLAVLVGTVIYFWDPTPAAPVTPPSQSETEDNNPGEEGKPAVGNKVGDLCPSVELPLLTVNGVSESQTIDPTKTGKVTIINFWGTWCGPCKAELPFFDEVAEKYADKVTVIAIHSYLGIDDGDEYIAEHYPNTKMIFARDNLCDQSDFLGTNGEFFLALGFRSAYPTTVIIDENGVITYTSSKAFHSTAELLAELPESVLGDEQVAPIEKEKGNMVPGLIAFGVMTVLGIGTFLVFQFGIRKKK